MKEAHHEALLLVGGWRQTFRMAVDGYIADEYSAGKRGAIE